jgi:hypothetical protein
VDTRVESRLCSFCGQVGSKQNRLAGGLGAMICFDCLDHYYHQSRSPEEVASRSGAVWAAMSDVEMLEKLPLILRSAQQNADFAHDWVALLRERGISWAAIGKVLGVSRQTAWERFAPVQARRRARR